MTDEEVSKALEYLYRKGTGKVKQFNKLKVLKKISVEKDGILFCKSRIEDRQRIQVTGGLENSELLSVFKERNLSLLNPVLDRYSPLSYAIAEHIHDEVMKHKGYETCYRCSLDHVFIIQGMNLFRELGEECVSCKKFRGQYLDICMAPLPDESFIIAPAFYCCQLDLMGPLKLYVPGHSILLRNRKIQDCEVWVMVSVCLVTKAVNLQVIEGKSADAVIDGVNRLGCEVGMPSLILIDQDS